MLALILCWLDRPRRRLSEVVDTDAGPSLIFVCCSCRKDHP